MKCKALVIRLIKTNKAGDRYIFLSKTESNKWCRWCYCSASLRDTRQQIFPRNLMESIFGSIAFDGIIFHSLFVALDIARRCRVWCCRRLFFLKASHGMWTGKIHNDDDNINRYISRLFKNALWNCEAASKCVYYPQMMNKFHRRQNPSFAARAFVLFSSSFSREKSQLKLEFYAARVSHNSMLLSCIWKYLPTCVIVLLVSCSPCVHEEARKKQCGVELHDSLFGI